MTERDRPSGRPPPAARASARRRYFVEETGGVDGARRSPLDPARDLVWPALSFLALDTETTGLDPATGRVMEVGWARFERREERASAAWLCSVGAALDPAVAELTGIRDEMLAGQPPFAARAEALLAALDDVDFVVAYNAAFDRAFLQREMELAGLALPDLPWVDPLVFVRELDRYQRGKKLSEAARRWDVTLDGPHRALADARAAGALLLRLAPFLTPRTLAELLEQQRRWSARQTTEPPPDEDAPADDA